MGYTARYFVSDKLYALSFRTIEGLPFVATLYMKLLLLGIMARAQRDAKVTLCHFIWMANHAHILAIFKDPDQAQRFYAEVQKKLTDSIKSLLGLPHLRLWERRPVIAQVLDLPAAINQTAYLYANPARANLVDSISLYPGCSSWDIFHSLAKSQINNNLGAKIDIQTVWVPFSKIPPLPAPVLKKHADIDFTTRLTPLGIPHTLELYPNAWMKCFGISSPSDVARVNQQILTLVEEKEKQHREARVNANKTVLGERLLRVQSILRSHLPSDRRMRRRVFVICSDREQREEFIAKVRDLCQIARKCYWDALRGINRLWPPGMFKPPLRPLASALV